jgi:hypothetical protein
LRADKPVIVVGIGISGTLVDLEAPRVHDCNMSMVSKVQRDQCPDDEIGVLATMGFYAMLVAFGLLLRRFSRSQNDSDRFWATLFLYWAGDLGAGLYVGLQVQKVFPNAGVIDSDQILLALVWETLVYDGPMFLLKKFSERRCCGGPPVLFAWGACLFGVVLGGKAIDSSYQPSTIVVVGHHPLVLGFLTFLLDFPKKVVQNHAKRFVKERVLCWPPEEEYTYLVTEMSWVLKELAEPLPNYVVVETVDKINRALVDVEDQGSPKTAQ